jgi:hypothetical protein
MAKKKPAKKKAPVKKVTTAPPKPANPGGPNAPVTAGGGGTGGATGPPSGTASGATGASSGTATSGSADLTGATTTAQVTPDVAADQSDQDLQAFFSSGVGPAYHYDMASQQAEANATTATTTAGSAPSGA